MVFNIIKNIIIYNIKFVIWVVWECGCLNCEEEVKCRFCFVVVGIKIMVKLMLYIIMFLIIIKSG